MKSIWLSLPLALSFAFAAGQSRSDAYNNYIEKADSLFKLQDYKQAAENFSRAFKEMGWKGKPEDRYKAARAWSLSGKPDSAFDCLERLVNKTGYSKDETLAEEEDLNALHADKRWQPLLEHAKRNKLPTGWYRWGRETTSYEMVMDSAAGRDGKNALMIRSVEPRVDGFGTIMSDFLANDYLQKRIRMTGYIRTKDVKGWAGLWMRVDQDGAKRSLAFDNMQDRPVKGTTDWKQYEVVLYVPENASRIAFGALLSGTGQIWFESLKFEEVDDSVPLTGRNKMKPNLDFDK